MKLMELTPDSDTQTFGSVQVRDSAEKGRGVFAVRQFEKYETVMIGRVADYVAERDMYSIQTGWNRHALFDLPSILSNHSCNPNCGLRVNGHGGYDFVAMRTIAADQEITWDYSMSEYVSIAVQDCKCGEANCRKKPSGYKDLDAETLTLYDGFCADYVLLDRKSG